ncbi:Nucleotidyltransferase, class I, C-terminal-like protein [Cynara cardunculus var. scolymus]|uniref:polynucleotide adenylyltransferase n=1 Tax=Cynara cardunculus var. scolymus TaxID=59895 RepID=A0A103XT66_CYNCS|nr:Nucleotidyltransferase, class I, C-terminal-like protein [Cynara cardunculus var. scolymus]
MRNVIDKLKEILMIWIKRVAYQRRLPLNQIKAASATLLLYGLYGLGVYNVESDIDVLCVAPCFASMTEDFFIVLYNMLAGRPEVSVIHCVKDAKVPLLQFTFEGILIDLAFAKLPVTVVPENVDISNPSSIEDIDETSWKSLSGVWVKNSILQLVPDVKIFREQLCCVKSWAKRRGVYGDNPSASLVDLVSIFFKTFAFWPWPEPVVLQEGATLPPLPPGTRTLMPIQLPSSPNEYCRSNMTTSTFNKIRAEFRRGYRQTQDALKPQFEWRNLFESFPYSKSCLRFVKVCLSTYNKDELGMWVHWVKSRIRCLLLKLEELQALCDPNPTEYIDLSIPVPNVVFYWGLVPGRGNNLNPNAAREEFMKNLSIGYQGNLGRMTLTIIQASQLPNILQLADAHIKAYLRLTNLKQMIPVYSKHSPSYVVGYLATDGNHAIGWMD